MSQPTVPRRPARWAGALLAGALAGVGLGAAAPPAGAESVQTHIVQDPYYGVTLFDFYQQRYFTALTELMVAQYFGRLPHHSDEAEVLRGGLYLSYGLHREAAEIFTRLINAGAAPSIRDRAWFFLAKIRYQRGLMPEAEDAIDRVKGLLPGDLEVDRILLHANLLMNRGDFARAAVILKPLADKDKPNLYVRYNLGVALVKSGAVPRGSEILDEIGVVPATTEELRTLRDKANVALGFAALQAQDPERARVYLERVRLNGMLANKALLGFGWAADALHQPKEALVPWMELASRDPSDPAVLEARLAVPYALAQVDAYGQSMDAYHDAISAFDRESANLDESIRAIRAGKLLDGLLASNAGEEMGWFWNIDHVPEMPHAAHLVPVLAQHEFQEAFKSYRDLQFLARNLRNWQDKMGIIGDMLDNRRLAFAQRLPKIALAEQAAGIDRYARQREGLAAELDAAAAKADGVAFADAKERALAARIERDTAILARDGHDPELDALAERLRRAAGGLTWQLAQEYPGRVWVARKDLQQLDAALVQARNSDAQLVKAQREEPQHFDEFALRIAALRERITALLPRVTELAQLQREAVQELAVAALEEQKQRLVVYGNQARFAVAQIYDRASQASRPAVPGKDGAAAVPGGAPVPAGASDTAPAAVPANPGANPPAAVPAAAPATPAAGTPAPAPAAADAPASDAHAPAP